MVAPSEVIDLVERFDTHRETYRSGHYNEAQVRQEFVNPLFKALSWDIYNEQGYAEAYKDVVHEDSVKVGTVTKAPDYCFRIGGTRKFFVEAKKPSVHVRDDASAAYQVRRYAWSAKLPLSILTNFEEFAVYDCRQKPSHTDKAAVGRVMLVSCSDYPNRWDEIAAIFSREAILKGSFDKYAESNKGKRGTAEVDDAFLEEIEVWRASLAQDIYRRNPRLTTRELNAAVQATINRIVFLRICEARGIEPYGMLLALTNGHQVYERLCQLFRSADERYNSGLFHFCQEKDTPEPPDEWTLSLTIDDKPLKDILRSLYYPENPYEFSVLPADILGQVYERFLGKVILLTPRHQAIVEDKPEVKKAGGVFYTPTYIVDYIVKNTVGEFLKGKTPKQAAKLKIADIACGSGSFLIAAYQYLLDWYRDAYVNEGSQKHRKELYQTVGGGWRLTPGERKRILLAHIYGVDIDAQAIEVTKLSLLLKVLEGESGETIATQLQFFRERALPNFSSNIKCGNSLVGPDFYQNAQMTFLDAEERYKVNVFDWRTEFPDIFDRDNGGFDTVIGNPPYLRIQGLQQNYGKQIDYFATHYESAVKRFDLYLLFVEKGFGLLRKGGRLGFICPHKFTNSDFGSGLRKFLIDNMGMESITSFGNNQIFRQASIYTGILLLSRATNLRFGYCVFNDMSITEVPKRLWQLSPASYANYDLAGFSEGPWTLAGKGKATVLEKLPQRSVALDDICDQILVGVQSGIDSVHVLAAVNATNDGIVRLFSERAGAEVQIEAGLLKPFLTGEDVHRYQQPRHSHYCVFPYYLKNGQTKILEEGELKERFPLGFAYLREYRKELTEIRIRQKTNPRYWYSCHRSRDMRVFETERIVTPEISLGCNMTIADSGTYHNTKVYSIVPSPQHEADKYYLLGLLNSRLMWWWISNTGYVLRGGYYVFKTNYLAPFPVRCIDFAVASDITYRSRMVEFVQQMLSLKRELLKAKTSEERRNLGRQVESVDRQIDLVVYELYGLADAEITTVEGASPGEAGATSNSLDVEADPKDERMSSP
ncbi:MAG: N-6 DNA methylase [Chloroflexi bacterium]|nr:N-6 DNA methylase [Chloroflexota bacterium]